MMQLNLQPKKGESYGNLNNRTLGNFRIGGWRLGILPLAPVDSMKNEPNSTVEQVAKIQNP